jgi:hypothetical protein
MQSIYSIKEIIHPDLLFLLYSCQTECTAEEETFLINHLQHTDIDHIAALASRHGVFPLLYHRVQSLDTLPSDTSNGHPIQALLKAHYLTLSKKNMFMSAELLRIITLFHTNHIGVLAFKGPVLAVEAYGDITLRQYGDIDLLVQPQDLPDILRLMQENGYIPDVSIPQAQREEILKLLTVIGFDKPDTGMRIEIHWELLSHNYAVDWRSRSLWEDRETVRLNHADVQTLAKEHLLLYLCIHGSKHLFERLEWVCDIDRLVRAHPDIDWDRVIDHAKETGTLRMLLLGLSLAQRFFRLPLPEAVYAMRNQDRSLSRLEQKIILLHFSQTAAQQVNSGYFFLLLQMRERFTDKIDFSYRAFFAPQFNDFNFLPLPKTLRFLYPLVRLYRLTRKYLFKR